MPTITQELNWKFKTLRQLLIKDKNYKQSLPIILDIHKEMHLSPNKKVKPVTICDKTLEGIDIDKYRIIPRNDNHSIAWRIWHIARIEDAATNILIADQPQIFSSGNWMEKLHTKYSDVGNDMQLDIVRELSESIDIKALLSYRMAVGKNTEKILRKMDPIILWEKPNNEQRNRLYKDRVLIQKGHWLEEYWCNNLRANLLLMPVTRHCLVHLNEIARIKAKLIREQAQQALAGNRL